MRRLLSPSTALVVLAAFFLVAVLPTRTWLQQREAIAIEEARIRVLSEENARLATRVEQLQTDAEIERLAREEYNLVRPGEEAYAILPPPAAPAGDDPVEEGGGDEVGQRAGAAPGAVASTADAAGDDATREAGAPWWRRALDAIFGD